MSEIQILNNGDSLYDIRRKINENFQLTKEEIEDVITDPLSQFGVNEGNVTDGVADLLSLTDGTLSFKVGGEYPNLVTTSGDGVTTEIESVNDLYLQNLADGEYTVVINGPESSITDAEFYSQLLEPETPNDGDVWFNGESSKQFKSDALTAVKLTTNTSTSFHWVAQINGTYVACAGGRSFYISNDEGTSWTQFTNNSLLTTFTHIGAVVYDGNLYTLGNDKNLYKNPHTTDFTSTPISLTSNPTNFKLLNGKFVATTQSGYVWYSDDLINWSETERIFENLIKDITFGNDTYYIIGQGGELGYSTDLNDWTVITGTTGGVVASCIKYYNNKLLIGKNSGYITIFDVETQQTTELRVNSNEGVIDVSVLPNNGILAISNYGTCYISYDQQTFTRLIDIGDVYLRRISLNKFVVGDSGAIVKLNQNTSWINYAYIPVGEVIISGGEVTYFTTYPYNSNGLHEATSSSFGLLRTAAETDEMDCTCNDAVITPSNLYGLSNYRLANTSYEVDDKVGCPYHHNLQLKCIQAGTTSSEGLDTKGYLEPKTTIQDGSVIWEVEQLGTGGLIIGQIVSMNCTANYVPDGCLPCDGAEYGKAQFTDLWNNWLTVETYYKAYYASELYGGATLTLYLGLDGEVYELVDGSMNRASYIITYTDDNEINFEYYIEGNDEPAISVAYRDTSKDLTQDLTSVTPLLNTCSYEDYEADLTTYGQCAKFAVDTTNETFRVPLIKDGAVIQQALSNDELGKAYNAGLPNITGSGPFTPSSSGTLTGAFYQSGSQSGNTSDGGEYDSKIVFDASLSNPIYGNSDTVQMNAIALRYFVVVANGQINESMMDWSEWASSLQGKVSYSDLEEIGQGGTGFYKLNDGLIVQWGSLTISASTAVVVTLPTPFSSTNYMVVQGMYSNGSSDSEKNWQTSTLTTTSFKAHNGQGGTCTFGWIAVGF